LKPGDLVLTLGAGDVWEVGEQLLKALKKKKESRSIGSGLDFEEKPSWQK
jgi:hypothetical protein